MKKSQSNIGLALLCKNILFQLHSTISLGHKVHLKQCSTTLCIFLRLNSNKGHPQNRHRWQDFGNFWLPLPHPLTPNIYYFSMSTRWWPLSHWQTLPFRWPPSFLHDNVVYGCPLQQKAKTKKGGGTKNNFFGLKNLLIK